MSYVHVHVFNDMYVHVYWHSVDSLTADLSVIHTLVILIQTVTFNVAVNSHSKALLTIMVSNNFVELKGSVFKKFEQNNLFQMSCSGTYMYMYTYILQIGAQIILSRALFK